VSYDIWLGIDTGGACEHVIASWNPTYNLAEAFHAALGISMQDMDGVTAGHAAPMLDAALKDVQARPEVYEPLCGPRWGDYRAAVSVLTMLSTACFEHPAATFHVS